MTVSVPNQKIQSNANLWKSVIINKLNKSLFNLTRQAATGIFILEIIIVFIILIKVVSERVV